jgi:uncharacterized repeat protein (TIGR03806 family)
MRWPAVALIVASSLLGLIQIGFSAALAAAGDASRVVAVAIDPEAELAESISAYRLFRDARKQVPNDGVVPYDLNTPHFADYATLHRFVWMPPGRSCQYGPQGELEFPVGAAIILTVGYAHDLRDPSAGEQIVETRLWIRRQAGWIGAQYVWDEQTTDARLALTGDQVDVAWIHSDGAHREHTFRVPNKNQCAQCHEIDDKLIPLGPVHARYLNKPFQFAHGAQNQLEYWAEIGYLSGLPEQPDQIPRVPTWNDPSSGDLNSRARAYLDMNCSACHRPGGIAITSGLDLRYEQDVPVRFGIFKAPVAAGRSAGIGRFVIEPGKPEKSILMMRLESTDPGIRMPIVGRDLMHAEGVELIRQWITELEYPVMAAKQLDNDQRRQLISQ